MFSKGRRTETPPLEKHHMTECWSTLSRCAMAQGQDQGTGVRDIGGPSQRMRGSSRPQPAVRTRFSNRFRRSLADRVKAVRDDRRPGNWHANRCSNKIGTVPSPVPRLHRTATRLCRNTVWKSDRAAPGAYGLNVMDVQDAPGRNRPGRKAATELCGGSDRHFSGRISLDKPSRQLDRPNRTCWADPPSGDQVNDVGPGRFRVGSGAMKIARYGPGCGRIGPLHP